MTTINNQEKTIIDPLGKALQEARLSASLTVEQVAEQLNLAVSTVRDIEDSLDNVIEDKKYPPIYLRGYIANYAKLVALDKLDQFIEYQALSQSKKHPPAMRSPMIIPPQKKRAKRLLFLFLLIISIAVCFFIVREVFFSENLSVTPAQPAIEETIEGSENSAAKSAPLKKEENTVAAEAATEVTDLISDEMVVASNKMAAEAAVVKEFVKQEQLEAQSVTAVVKEPEAQKKNDSISSKQLVAENVADIALQNSTVQAVTSESLQLTFAADCWTEIFDATGQRLAFNLYKKGSLLMVSGVAPFQLKLGDPSVVAIQYQNKIIEHDFAAGRTKRFSIPQ